MFKPAARPRHDARVFVSQIDLILGLRTLERWCRGSAARLLAARRRLLVPRRQLGAVLGHLPLKAFFGAGFKLGARLGKLRQTLFSARQFLRDRHAIRHISLIRGFRLRQQSGHFGLQLGLDLAGMFIGERSVPAGIGVDFRAVQSHRAKLEQAHLARQLQHPHE